MNRNTIFILLTGFLCGTAAASTAPDSINLDEVTVTAQTYKDVIPAQTLKGKELDALRTHSVADALRFFSGVQLKDYGGVGGIKTVHGHKPHGGVLQRY